MGMLSQILKSLVENKRTILDLLKTWIPLVLSILGVVAFFKTCRQDQINDERYYLEQATSHRPLLEVVDASFYLNFKSHITDTGNVFIENGKRIKPLYVELQYDTMIVHLVLFNRGTATAQLRGVCSVDTMTGEPHLRDLVLGKLGSKNIEVGRLQGFFPDLNVLPNSSDSLDLVLIQRRNPGEKGVLHIMLNYENEMGSLYDTYYRYVFTIGSPQLKTLAYSKDTNGVGIHLGESQRKLSEQLIQKQVSRLDYKIYSSKEREDYESFGRELEKSLVRK